MVQARVNIVQVRVNIVQRRVNIVQRRVNIVQDRKSGSWVIDDSVGGRPTHRGRVVDIASGDFLSPIFGPNFNF